MDSNDFLDLWRVSWDGKSTMPEITWILWANRRLLRRALKTKFYGLNSLKDARNWWTVGLVSTEQTMNPRQDRIPSWIRAGMSYLVLISRECSGWASTRLFYHVHSAPDYGEVSCPGALPFWPTSCKSALF